MINTVVILLQAGYQTLLERRYAASRDRGATAVEYALIVSLIAVAIVAIVTTLGDTIADIFSQTNEKIAPGGGGGGAGTGEETE